LALKIMEKTMVVMRQHWLLVSHWCLMTEDDL
jgi:hypothetical protein